MARSFAIEQSKTILARFCDSFSHTSDLTAIWLVFLPITITVQLNMNEQENGQRPIPKQSMRSRISSERWEQIKTAHASGIGLREIARNMGIPEGTVLARAKREGWTQQIQSAAKLAKHNDRAHAVTPMEAVAGTLSKRKDKSALHLSRYVVDASRNAAMSRGDLDEAQNVRHVAAVRSHLWPERQDCPMEQMAVHIAILNV
jgi:hypothetical protein